MKIKSLSEITNPKQWKNLSISKLKDSGFPVYGANGIIGFFDEYNHANPTIAITCRGATCGNIHITLENSYITSNAMALDDLDENECKLNYLAKYLRYRGLSDVTTGAAQPQITRANLEKVKIPLPPLDNQIRIAHLLGKVEALIAQRKQHLQQLDDLLKSVFLEMFGDPVRNEKGWKLTTIGDLSIEVKYGTSVSAQGGQYKYLRMNNITKDGYWDFRSLKYIDVDDKDFEKYSLRKGDLVFNRTNSKELVGKSAVYDRDEPVVIAGYLIRVRFKDDTNPWFVWGHLNSKLGKNRLFNLCRNIVGMANINAQELKGIPILKPPIELQNQFAVIVEKIEGVKSRYQKNLVDLEALYGALSQQAFKGELGLSRVPLPAMKPAEDEPVTIEPIQPRATEISTNLPDTDNLLDALENAEARKALISKWLEAYRGQPGNTLFSVQLFMAAAQTRLAELHPETDFELGANDYEHIKTWVFEALADGRLQQSRDITGHDESGEPILGNLIEIKSGARP